MIPRTLLTTRQFVFVTLTMIVVLGSSGLSAYASGASPRERLNQHLLRTTKQVKGKGGDARSSERSRNVTQVGFLPLPGFNADVWAHKGYAYVGSWGLGDLCPATGVRIVDLGNGSDPELIGAVAEIPGTSQEDVEVHHISTRYFNGDLLATGVQFCGESGQQGVDLWDVSDPTNPVHLGFWDSEGAFGVHELTLFQVGDRAYVGAATSFSEFAIGEGDFRLIDVTDPRNPVQVGEWGLGDIGLAPQCDDAACMFAHSVTVDQTGRTAIISYWDYGAVYLDISDPENPTFVGRTVYPAGSDGDTHSVALARGGNLLLTADEDFSPIAGGDSTWGYLRIWDVKDPSNPVQVGTFATPDALSGRTDGFFSIHNPVVRGNTAYLSWYGNGLRIVDISQPSAPREIGSFVPPGAEDPYEFFPTGPNVWGVVLERNLILLSDINAGLYVLRQKP